MPLQPDILAGFLDKVRNGTIDNDEYDTLFAQCNIAQKKQVQAAKIGSTVSTGVPKRTVEFSAAIASTDLANERFNAPFANSGIKIDDFGPRWWFEYFWKEARSQTQSGKSPRPGMSVAQILAETAGMIFAKEPEGGSFKLKLQPHMERWNTPVPGRPASKGRQAVDTNQIWKESLRTLLQVGFRAVKKQDLAPQGYQALELDDKAQEHILQQRLFGKEVRSFEKEFTPSEVPVYWRSETRDLKKILSQSGTRRQCDVDVLARDLGMDADWHPFSDPEIKKYMWFRLGNSDNDYFTVISVATDFESCCGFPKIDERRVYQFPAVDVAHWSKAQADRFRGNLALVTENGKALVRLVTVTTTYMLVHNGSVLDTRGAARFQQKESFAEIGVEQIPLESIYAVIPIKRVHHGPDPGDGFTVFVDYANCKRLHEGKEVDLFGLQLSTRLFEIYLEKIRRSQFATAWAKTGCGEPHIKMSITRVQEYPIGQAAFDNFKKTLGTADTSPTFDQVTAYDHRKNAMKEFGTRITSGQLLPPAKK